MDDIYVAIIGLVGVLVGHIITKQMNDKNNYLQYITDERRKWREDIRQLTSELYKDKEKDKDKDKDNVNINHEDYYRLLKTKFEIRLNPNDEEDQAILNSFDKLIENSKEPNDSKFNTERQELVERITLLLKHDWERVKVESNESFFPKGLYFLIYLTGVFIITPILLKCFAPIEFDWQALNLSDLNMKALNLNDLKLQEICYIIHILIKILIYIGWTIVGLRMVLKLSNEFKKNTNISNFIKDSLNIPRRTPYKPRVSDEKKKKVRATLKAVLNKTGTLESVKSLLYVECLGDLGR